MGRHNKVEEIKIQSIKYKIQDKCLIYLAFYILYFLSCFLFVFLIGCGEKEDKNLLSVRGLIQQGKYKTSQERSQIRAELQKVLAKDPNNPEALCPIKAIDIIDKKLDPKTAINEIISLIKPLDEKIKQLESIDKDLITDEEKEELNKLHRKWNLSIEPAIIILTSDIEWIENSDDIAFDFLIESLKITKPDLQDKIISLLVQFKSKSFDYVVKALENSDSIIRSKAIIILGHIGDERAIENIAALLKDNNPEVRFHVPIALRLIGGDRIIEPLHQALSDESSQVRLSAANILGELKDETAIDLFIERLADDNAYVKTSASDALIRIGVPAIGKLVETLQKGAENVTLVPSDYTGEKVGNRYQKELAKRTNIQVSIISILGSIKDPSSIEPLIEAMKREPSQGATEFEKSNVASIRTAAVSALSAIGAPTVETLIKILGDKSQSEIARVNSASILGAIGDRRAVTPLILALKNENKSVRATAATALGVLKDIRALDPLIETLKDTDLVVRTNAAESLGLFADKRATQPLINLIMDKNEREKTRTVAIDSLGLIKDTASLEILVKILIDEYEKDGIRKSASNSLRSLENTYASEPLIALLKGEIVRGIFMPQKGVVTRWLKEEKSKNLIKDITPLIEISRGKMKTTLLAPISGNLIKIYVKDGESADTGALLGLISYKDPEIKKEERSSLRNMASLALGKVKGESAVPALIEALRKDDNAAVRKNAVVSLREIENANARSALIKALNGDNSGVVRSEAAYALGVGALKHADNVEPLIKAMRKDKYESTRVRAAWSLGEIADKRAVEPLIDLLVKGRKKGEKESPAVIVQIITALDKIATPAVGPLIEVLKNKDIDEVPRSKAAQILGLIENTDAVEPLISALKDDSVVVRSESAISLGLINDRQAVEPLINVANNANEWVTVRINALNSLGKLKDEKAVPILLEALKSNVDAIRNNAVIAFGQLKDKRAVPQLIKIVENEKEDDNIRVNAISSLSNIGDINAFGAILNALKSKNVNVRQAAIIASGDLAIKEATSILISIVKNMDELISLRASAVEALGKIGDKSVSPVLSERLTDRNESDTVWIKLAEAVGKLHAPVITEWVSERAQNTWEPVSVRSAALMALSGTGKSEDFELVLKMLDDGTKEIRSASALALGNSGNKSATQPLITKLQKDSEEIVRRDSAKALGILADPSAEQALIKSFLEDGTASVKNESAIALGNIKGKNGISALINVLQDTTKANDHRWNSAVALGNAKSSEAISALENALQSNNGNIHFESAEALRKITGKNYGYER